MLLCGSFRNIFGRASVIDNYVFRLHYRITFTLLLIFAFFVAFEQYVGDPIICYSKDDLSSKVLNKLCWMHSTFTLSDGWDKKVGSEVPFPGIDKYSFGAEKIHYDYYQFVFIALLLQAITFYLPRYFWKRMEGGLINDLTFGLNSLVLKEEEKLSKKGKVAEYLATHMSCHNFYFTCYVFAEIWNFCNVIGQIVFIDNFLGGGFLSAVHNIQDISGWSRMHRSDSMLQIFPRVTKCLFHRYGSSGDIQRHDVMCFLPINVINEKIYIFLFVWFVIVAVLSGLALVYRAVSAFQPKFRSTVTALRVRCLNPYDLELIMRKCDLADWMILDLLSKNMDSLSFRDVMLELAPLLKEKKKVSNSNISLHAADEASIL